MIQIPVSETTLAQMKIGNTFLIFTPWCWSQICDVRNALTGFRSGWKHLKSAVTVPSTSDDTDEPAKVDRLDYAADGSEDNTKEAASMSIKRPTMDNDPSKVRSNEFYP